MSNPMAFNSGALEQARFEEIKQLLSRKKQKILGQNELHTSTSIAKRVNKLYATGHRSWQPLR